MIAARPAQLLSSLMNCVRLNRAVDCLHRGGVVAYPTEGVWGLGADPLDQAACGRILDIKHRDWRKGLILVGASIEQISAFVEVPSQKVWDRVAATWPGPVTWIFPKSDLTPEWVSGDQNSVAVRVSAHPIVRALCNGFGGALISTSANPASRPPAMSATQVRMYFSQQQIDALVPGALGGLDAPSTIRDALSDQVLR